MINKKIITYMLLPILGIFATGNGELNSETFASAPIALIDIFHIFKLNNPDLQDLNSNLTKELLDRYNLAVNQEIEILEKLENILEINDPMDTLETEIFRRLALIEDPTLRRQSISEAIIDLKFAVISSNLRDYVENYISARNEVYVSKRDLDQSYKTFLSNSKKMCKYNATLAGCSKEMSKK